MNAILTILEYELKAVRALLASEDEKVRKAAAERERVLLREITRDKEGEGCTKLDDIARRIAHEDEMVNRRINWMLVFQGFLFAAMAELAGKGATGESGSELLQILFCCAGGLVSLLAVCAVFGAKREIDELMGDWRQECIRARQNGSDPVRPFGSPLNHLLGLLYSLGLPAVIGFAWALLLLCKLCSGRGAG